MNVSVINIKEIKRKLTLLTFIVLLFFGIKLILNQITILENIFTFERCSKIYTNIFTSVKSTDNIERNINIIKFNFPILMALNNKQINKDEDIKPNNLIIDEIKISKTPNIDVVSERNIEESYNFKYEDVKIKNQSNYDLSNITINPNEIRLNNKNIIIYHTHTCESYTPSEKYNYTMTGNYRTTDNNYNVVKLGETLKNYLVNKGFNVIHNTSYHDYPSYNGSYDRSYETLEKILKENSDVSLIIDIHRDAVGDGSWYGPTISMDGQKVAQMMFVMRNRWRRIKSSKLDSKF